jgi:hypothetical protein
MLLKACSGVSHDAQWVDFSRRAQLRPDSTLQVASSYLLRGLARLYRIRWLHQRTSSVVAVPQHPPCVDDAIFIWQFVLRSYSTRLTYCPAGESCRLS